MILLLRITSVDDRICCLVAHKEAGCCGLLMVVAISSQRGPVDVDDESINPEVDGNRSTSYDRITIYGTFFGVHKS
jgi:hypothetical protein